MLNDIQITSDYMSRWVVLERRVGAVTSQRVLFSNLRCLVSVNTIITYLVKIKAFLYDQSDRK
jgi:hypothetical protein